MIQQGLVIDIISAQEGWLMELLRRLPDIEHDDYTGSLPNSDDGRASQIPDFLQIGPLGGLSLNSDRGG